MLQAVPFFVTCLVRMLGSCHEEVIGMLATRFRRKMHGLARGAVACVVVAVGLASAWIGCWNLAAIASGSDQVAQATSSTRSGATAWDEVISPDYYRVVGTAVVDQDVAAGTVSYSSLDALGRTGRAVACVTHQMVEMGGARERTDMSDIHPSGWGHNAIVDIVQPNGSVYHGYLFNRSHLIAKSLGGVEIAENLVTGTRMQNVGVNDGGGGMAYSEGLARTWLDKNPEGTVWYSSTPTYEGNEVVPRSVIVDLLSSDGALDLELEVYNTAWGYSIDYADGSYSTK